MSKNKNKKIPNKLSSEDEKIEYIKEYSRGATATRVREEIGRVWNLKKSARNEKFRKHFGELSGAVYLKKEPLNAANFSFNSKAFDTDNETKPIDGKRGKAACFKSNGNEGSAEVKGVEDIRTLEDLVEYARVDMDVWEPTKFYANVWNDMWQVKGEFKRKAVNTLVDILEGFKKDLADFSPIQTKFKYKNTKEGKLLVVNIADAHIGKLSAKELSGHNYDLKIAKEIYIKTLKDLVAKALKQGDIEKVWYVAGNDYLTIDNPQNTTTKGTIQEIDTRFNKIFRDGRKLLIESVEILKEVAPVHIIVMPGNHDRSAMFHLGDALECWYRNDENVTVDNEDKLRKYYTYKDCVFGITHNDTIKQEKLLQMGLVEYGKEWGAAKRRFWFTHHIHHLKVQNIQGQEIWTFPSISGSDEYHQSHGYVGSTRSALAMIFSKDNLEAVFQSQPIEDKDYQ